MERPAPQTAPQAAKIPRRFLDILGTRKSNTHLLGNLVRWGVKAEADIRMACVTPPTISESVEGILRVMMGQEILSIPPNLQPLNKIGLLRVA